MGVKWTKLSALAAALMTTVATFGPHGAGAETSPSSARYGAATNPNNIAPTVATRSHQSLRAFGEPRMTVGHPNTTWDAEDIRHYKKMLTTSAELRQLLSDLRKTMDERIGKPIEIPPPQKGPDGAWLYPGDYFPDFPGRPHADNPVQNFSRFLDRDSQTIASLGILYALTDDAKYAKYARDLLIAYSNLPRYGASTLTNYRYSHGLTSFTLEDSLDLLNLARGYDLIYNFPALSAADRTRIHDELLRPLASVMLYPTDIGHDPTATVAAANNNRAALGDAAVLLAGYATDDQELVDAALYGTRTTLTDPRDAAWRYKHFPPLKDWVAATADHPSAGLLTVHLAPADIPAGTWVEGSPAYSFYALQGLVSAAEAGWRHGIDLYHHNDSIMKYLFDFPLLLAYPDMSIAAENDSHRLWLRSPTLYDYGYLRYRDPRYLAIINRSDRRPSFGAGAQGAKQRADGESGRRLIDPWAVVAPPAVFFDLDPREEAPPPKFPDVNFPAVGFGVLRAPAENGPGLTSLTLSYGPAGSHGHPDKLHIDLWALDDILMPSPGVLFPYDNPLDPKWHWTTLAHNTLTVDEANQHYLAHPPQKEQAHADQLVYGPAERFGVQRAWSDTVYPGVTLDRSLCLTRNYLADLFAAFSTAPHKYDLAWHIRGKPTSELPFAVSPFPDPVPNGYNAFTEVRQAPRTNGAWSVAFGEEGRFARFLAAGGTPTQPVLGSGGTYADTSPGGKPVTSTAPTLIERREALNATVFGNVLDVSGGRTGFVKAVRQLGGQDQGFGLLSVETTDGADLCFASYRSGVHSAAGLETDALQALVEMKGSSPRAIYLGGGTIVKVGDAALQRSEEGLASIEADDGGGYVVSNPSPKPATVTVSLKALEGLEAHDLDDEGKPKGKADVVVQGAGVFALRLDAGARVGFFPPGEP